MKTGNGELVMDHLRFGKRRNEYSAKKIMQIIRDGKISEEMLVKCCLFNTCAEALQNMKKRGFR